MYWFCRKIALDGTNIIWHEASTTSRLALNPYYHNTFNYLHLAIYICAVNSLQYSMQKTERVKKINRCQRWNNSLNTSDFEMWMVILCILANHSVLSVCLLPGLCLSFEVFFRFFWGLIVDKVKFAFWQNTF